MSKIAEHGYRAAAESPGAESQSALSNRIEPEDAELVSKLKINNKFVTVFGCLCE